MSTREARQRLVSTASVESHGGWHQEPDPTHDLTDSFVTILLDFSLIAPGGSETYAKAFLDALSTRSDLADVIVLVPHQHGEMEETTRGLREAGATVQEVQLGTGWGSALWRQFLVPYYSLRLGAHAVYAPRETAPLLTPRGLVVLARNLAVWVPVEGASLAARAGGSVRRLFARLVLHRAKRVLAVSTEMRRYLPASVASSTIVVHHGCDLEVVPHSRLDAGHSPRILRVVALGTICRAKRFDRIVEAVATLREQGQPADLEIWGSFREQSCAAALRRQARERLGADPLRGPAHTSDRQRILADADVLAMGSSFESFAFPLVEAMRTSCLVWAPSSKLLDEICGSAAVSYPEDSPAEAARALIGALPNARDLLALGRERCRSFTWPLTVTRTLAVVRQAAAPSGPSLN